MVAMVKNEAYIQHLFLDEGEWLHFQGEQLCASFLELGCLQVNLFLKMYSKICLSGHLY